MPTTASESLPPQPRDAMEGSAVDNVVEQIKTYIQTNALTVGDSLPSERELGDKFDAARNTVREAVRILKAYGVVEVRPKIGAVIVNRHMDAVLDLFSFQLSISRETFIDIQGFRRLIEVGSADAILAVLTEGDVARLNAINGSILRARSAVEGAERDFAFHAALLELAGNQTVLDVYMTMKPIIVQLMQTGKQTRGLQATYDSHATILECLESGNRLALKYWWSSHFDDGLKFIDRTMPTGAAVPGGQERIS